MRQLLSRHRRHYRTARPRACRNINRGAASGPTSCDPATIDPSLLVTPPVRRRPPPEEDPFAPTGIHVGAFHPATGNRGRRRLRHQSGARARRASRLGMRWWRRNCWSIRTGRAMSSPPILRGSYIGLSAGLRSQSSEPRRPRQWPHRRHAETPALIFEGRYLISTDRPGSPNIQADLARLPIAQTFGGHRRPRPTLQPSRGDGQGHRRPHHLSGLDVHRRRDRDQRRPQLQSLRRRHARQPTSLRPASSRSLRAAPIRALHDVTIDRFGVCRNSTGGYARAGTTFEISRILTGDIAVGWIARNYVDPTLPNISKPSCRRVAALAR